MRKSPANGCDIEIMSYS